MNRSSFSSEHTIVEGGRGLVYPFSTSLATFRVLDMFAFRFVYLVNSIEWRIALADPVGYVGLRLQVKYPGICSTKLYVYFGLIQSVTCYFDTVFSEITEFSDSSDSALRLP